MSSLFRLLLAGLLSLLAFQPAAAQPGFLFGSGRIGGVGTDRIGLPIPDLTLLDMGSPTGRLPLLLPVVSPNSALAFDLRLTPNPAAGLVRIELEVQQPLTGTLTVRDVLGRLVRAPFACVLPIGAHVLPLDLTDQPAGVYVVTVATTSHHITQRLLKR